MGVIVNLQRQVEGFHMQRWALIDGLCRKHSISTGRVSQTRFPTTNLFADIVILVSRAEKAVNVYHSSGLVQLYLLAVFDPYDSEEAIMENDLNSVEWGQEVSSRQMARTAAPSKPQLAVVLPPIEYIQFYHHRLRSYSIFIVQFTTVFVYSSFVSFSLEYMVRNTVRK